MAQTIETGSEDILAHVEDGVAVIILNRPQARNAMSAGMTQGLDKALDFAERSAEVRAVVVTGAGKAFCAGGDVKGMAAGGSGKGAGPTLDERIHAQRLTCAASEPAQHRRSYVPNAQTCYCQLARRGRRCGFITRVGSRLTRYGRYGFYHHGFCARGF